MPTATSDTTAALDVQDLSDLLGAVNVVTGRLQKTHEALRRQVSQLQQELATANAQLRRSESLAALGEMAAGIAHEIRNPLGSIRLYAQMLEEDLGENPDGAGLCSKINAAVHRLDAIVTDVLAFARQTTIKRRAVDVMEVVDQALQSCAGLLARGGIEVVVNHPDPPIVVSSDAGLLAQAISNVIRNAVEAMLDHSGAPPRLTVEARKERRRLSNGSRRWRAVVTVEDNGPGVPPSIIGRMFNPFFTTREEGTGLGLAIVHRIMDAHGGEVAVAEVDGGGTRIELCLPSEPPRPRSASDKDAPVPEISVNVRAVSAGCRRNTTKEPV